MTAWQQLPLHTSDTLFSIGSFQLKYYGLSYITAFAISYFLCHTRIKKEDWKLTYEQLGDLFTWGILGVVLGGRIGYILFYQPTILFTDPLEVVRFFELKNGFRFTGISGMSYHGAVIGVIVAVGLFAHFKKFNIWELGDLFTPTVPLGYFFGRMANFMNGELYGRVTEVPWGMVFPHAPDGQLRHPSQLYEAFFEGIVCFIFLWVLRKKRPFYGFLTALYWISYGTVRFFIEFFRQPDAHLGTILGPLSMGQILCLGMILGGGALIFWKNRGLVQKAI